MPEPPLPSVRASDADRERTADVVRKAAGAGRLTVEELDERLEAVYAARTRGELDALVEDLPASEPGPSGVVVRRGEGGTRWVIGIMGGSDRKGRWRVGRRVRAINVMGGSDLDFNDAEFADDVVELTVFSIMGGSNIWVPEGLDVQVSEFALMGGNDVDVAQAPAESDSPVLRIRAISIMGGTDIRRGRKRSRKERRRERRRHGELHR